MGDLCTDPTMRFPLLVRFYDIQSIARSLITCTRVRKLTSSAPIGVES